MARVASCGSTDQSLEKSVHDGLKLNLPLGIETRIVLTLRNGKHPLEVETCRR